jgi:hypothetical protein
MWAYSYFIAIEKILDKDQKNIVVGKKSGTRKDRIILLFARHNYLVDILYTKTSELPGYFSPC